MNWQEINTKERNSKHQLMIVTNSYEVYNSNSKKQLCKYILLVFSETIGIIILGYILWNK